MSNVNVQSPYDTGLSELSDCAFARNTRSSLAERDTKPSQANYQKGKTKRLGRIAGKNSPFMPTSICYFPVSKRLLRKWLMISILISILLSWNWKPHERNLPFLTFFDDLISLACEFVCAANVGICGQLLRCKDTSPSIPIGKIISCGYRP